MNLESIKNNILNIPGWKTNRKFIIIESDDWGTIRTSSNIALDKLKKSGIDTDKCHYTTFDSLESEQDLIALFETLSRYKDSVGNNPVFTANSLVANPDFEKIKANSYTKYFYELVTETYKRYPSHSRSHEIIKEGISNKLFHPELHGREHLNIPAWLEDLRNDFSETRMCFDLGIFGLSATLSSVKRESYLAAFNQAYSTSQESITEIISDAVMHFKTLYGYKPLSFIAPNYVWNDKVEYALDKAGVKYIQGSRVQQLGGIERKRKSHSLGQRNKLGQYYLVRNCQFEPSSNQNINWVDTCLKEISTAFFWNKPAIISTHRVNFMGFLNPNNREANLKLLNALLKAILKKWPDVEFITSDQLGKLIENDN